MSFRFNLNAAVTRPISGDHTSLHKVTAAGTSYRSSLPESEKSFMSQMVSSGPDRLSIKLYQICNSN